MHQILLNDREALTDIIDLIVPRVASGSLLSYTPRCGTTASYPAAYPHFTEGYEQSDQSSVTYPKILAGSQKCCFTQDTHIKLTGALEQSGDLSFRLVIDLSADSNGVVAQNGYNPSTL